MKKVRFGVVGTNFITDWVIAGAAQDSRFELAAVCSRTEARAEEFARRYNIPYRYTSLEEMAASPFIDAVYIATPNALHASQSILAMSYGRHVLCEKPLASNSAEAKAMIEASRRYDVTLMEAMKPTLTPNFRAVLDNFRKVGKVRRYFSSYCQYSSRYDRFKAGEAVNAFRPEYSNGAIMDIGVYTIYPMVVLFGMPDRISASGILLSSGTDGQGSALFRYGDGMEAAVLYSKIADSYLPSEIQGEDAHSSRFILPVLPQQTGYKRSASNPGKPGKTECDIEHRQDQGRPRNHIRIICLPHIESVRHIVDQHDQLADHRRNDHDPEGFRDRKVLKDLILLCFYFFFHSKSISYFLIFFQDLYIPLSEVIHEARSEVRPDLRKK